MLETFRLIAHRAAVWFVAMRQREYRRPHSPAPHSSTPSVFNWNIPSPAAFLGRAVFLCTVPLSLLSRSRRTGAKKAALRQCFYGTFLGKVSLKLLRRIIVEACQVGGLQKLLPPDAYGSGSRPHPGTAGPQATAYAVDTLADDSRSYSRLISGSGCRSLTCRIQQRKQHPMRWAPFRMISLAECKPLRHG
ncbi:hypothetical protein NXX23_20000 [Bacteroides ovatus]|nr:hypothetical protein [Bacteroides ovatus]MCS2761793.1 hypothetical protein [Bacteroides ovatus]